MNLIRRSQRPKQDVSSPSIDSPSSTSDIPFHVDQSLALQVAEKSRKKAESERVLGKRKGSNMTQA
eukprot:760471-Hanusia_phi.AAC.2